MATLEQTGSLYRRSRRAADGKSLKSAHWYGAFSDPRTGKRVTRKLYTDKAASRAELTRLIKEAERQAAGLSHATDDELKSPIRGHIDAYIAQCRAAGQAAMHVHNKKAQLKRLASSGISRLAELTPRMLSDHLDRLRESGLSARTVNQHRATAIAFLAWCVQTGRAERNPLRMTPRLDERKDRRRQRRSLSADELGRLLDAAGPRRLIYLTAAATGLRRNELRSIRWGDLDTDERLLTVRIGVGKASREDTIPLHPAVAEELKAARPIAATDSETVFPSVPRPSTFQRDLKRAEIRQTDASGRVVDFHALRATLATWLARAGASPQVTTTLMRHADIRTTMRHYTDLGTADGAAALATLPIPGCVTEPPASADDMAAPVAAPKVPEGAEPGRSGQADRDGGGPPAGSREGSESRYTPGDSSIQAPEERPAKARHRTRPGTRETRAHSSVG